MIRNNITILCCESGSSALNRGGNACSTYINELYVHQVHDIKVLLRNATECYYQE